MATKQRKKYCYLEPKFPQNAFVMLLFIMKEDQVVGAYPLVSVFQDMEEAMIEINAHIKAVSEQENYYVEEEAVLLPISFTAHVPLKREYWKKPSEHYDGLDRMRLFQRVAVSPGFFTLLVTPTFKDTNEKWYLSATIPLLSPSEKVIEQFMNMSDQVVDERAKYAALYRFGTPKKYNWKTRTITAIDISEIEEAGKN